MPQPTPTPLSCAIFGKHPTAADHLEDIGLSSPALVEFKRVSYVEGIADCLNKSRWSASLGGSPESIPYNHRILFTTHTEWIASDWAASSDARGRKQYPICLAASGQSRLDHGLAEIGKELQSALTKTNAALEQFDIKAIQRSTQAALTEISPVMLPLQKRLEFFEALGLKPDELTRLLYALSPAEAGLTQFRVPMPMSQENEWDAAVLWESLLRTLSQRSASVTLIWPEDAPFIDVTLGQPDGRALRPIFAPLSSLPYTHTVPYSIGDATFSAQLERIESWKSGNSPPSASTGGKESRPNLIKNACKSITDLFKRS